MIIDLNARQNVAANIHTTISNSKTSIGHARTMISFFAEPHCDVMRQLDIDLQDAIHALEDALDASEQIKRAATAKATAHNNPVGELVGE